MKSPLRPGGCPHWRFWQRIQTGNKHISHYMPKVFLKYNFSRSGPSMWLNQLYNQWCNLANLTRAKASTTVASLSQLIHHLSYWKNSPQGRVEPRPLLCPWHLSSSWNWSLCFVLWERRPEKIAVLPIYENSCNINSLSSLKPLIDVSSVMLVLWLH